jgi:hypothetical protein
MASREKPSYRIAKYDKANRCNCECECQLPVTVTVAYSGKMKTAKALSSLKKETPDITIISE